MSTSKHPKAAKTYASTMDWWVALSVGLILLLLLASLVVIGAGDSVIAKLVAVGIVCVTSVSIIDKAFFTTYALLPDRLIVRSQLRHAEFAYRSMAKIRPGSLLSLITRPSHKRFALAGNCLLIEMAKNAVAWKSISISPNNRDVFLKELLRHIDDERSRRVTRAKD